MPTSFSIAIYTDLVRLFKSIEESITKASVSPGWVG